MRKYRPTTDKPRSRVKKYREGGPVGEPAGERIMLDEVDVVAPKFQPKGLFKGVRERFARNISPLAYNSVVNGNALHRLVNTIILNNPENMTGGISPRVTERKALLDLSMGLPVRDEAIGALSVSDYRPSSSTDNDTTYFRSKETEDTLVQSYLSDEEHLDWLNERLNEGDGKFIQGGGAVLGNYTVSRGEDENGTYLSYYDVWDLNPVDNIPGVRDVVYGAQSLAGVNPPEVYGRIYVDTDDKGNIIGVKNRQPKKSKRYRNETQED